MGRGGLLGLDVKVGELVNGELRGPKWPRLLRRWVEDAPACL